VLKILDAAPLDISIQRLVFDAESNLGLGSFEVQFFDDESYSTLGRFRH
jgi:hypothetical protein